MQLMNAERYKDATWRIDRGKEYSNTTKFEPWSSKSSYVTNKNIKIEQNVVYYWFYLNKILSRVTGLAHTWFGGPGEPSPGKKHEFAARVFLRHPDTRIVGLSQKNTSPTLEKLQPAALGTGRKPGRRDQCYEVEPCGKDCSTGAGRIGGDERIRRQ